MAALVSLELKLKPEAVQTLRDTLPAMLPDTRKYPGSKDVRFYLQKDYPTVAVAVEHWKTSGHYEKYLAWRTETGAFAKLGELVAAQPSATS
jgi:quinol monooxygenase YgiN